MTNGAGYLVYEHSKSIDVTCKRWAKVTLGKKDLRSCPIDGSLGHGKNIEHDGVQPEICKASPGRFIVTY